MSKADNRANMPTVAQIVDELRAQGIDVKVLYASEAGKTIGKKTTGENAYTLDPLRFKAKK